MGIQGPMARNVNDLRLTYQIIAGNEGDLYYQTAPVNVTSPPLKKAAEYKLAFMDEFSSHPIDAEYKRVINETIKKLTDSGFTQLEKKFSEDLNLEYAYKAWADLMAIMIVPNVPEIPPGLAALPQSELTKSMKAALADPSMKFFASCITRRDDVVHKIELFLSNYDALLFPVMMPAPFKHHNVDFLEINGKKVDYILATIFYNAFFSIGGQPVVTIPIGFTKEGLPLGIQIVGKRHSDMNLLNVAQSISKKLKINIFPPGF